MRMYERGATDAGFLLSEGISRDGEVLSMHMQLEVCAWLMRVYHAVQRLGKGHAMRYVIGESLVEDRDNTKQGQYVVVLTVDEWREQQAGFDMGIDIEPDWSVALDMQAEENYDSITGAIRVPNRSDLSIEGTWFTFALDEKGVVFIDSGGTAEGMVRMLQQRKWRNPGLERFLYDFLLLLIRNDAAMLKRYELELDRMEGAIFEDRGDERQAQRVNEIRSDMRDLDDYYEHLQDFATVLEENENGFFREENLRYFRLFNNRVEKLRDKTQSLSEQTIQVRDLYKMHLDIKQNRIVTVLTVLTAIFAPLTLIAGWYGMNFEHMPELAWPWAYPAVLVMCLVVAATMLAYFRHKRWL